jgi:hypothetical protein
MIIYAVRHCLTSGNHLNNDLTADNWSAGVPTGISLPRTPAWFITTLADLTASSLIAFVELCSLVPRRVGRARPCSSRALTNSKGRRVADIGGEARTVDWELFVQVGALLAIRG